MPTKCVLGRQVQAKTAETADCFSTSETCVVATAMLEQGTSCLRSGGGETVVVLVGRAAMLCKGIDTVSQY